MTEKTATEMDYSELDQNTSANEVSEFTPEEEAYFEKMMGLDDPEESKKYEEYLEAQEKEHPTAHDPVDMCDWN